MEGDSVPDKLLDTASGDNTSQAQENPAFESTGSSKDVSESLIEKEEGT